MGGAVISSTLSGEFQSHVRVLASGPTKEQSLPPQHSSRCVQGVPLPKHVAQTPPPATQLNPAQQAPASHAMPLPVQLFWQVCPDVHTEPMQQSGSL
jgi:hypothetical protein